MTYLNEQARKDALANGEDTTIAFGQGSIAPATSGTAGEAAESGMFGGIFGSIKETVSGVGDTAKEAAVGAGVTALAKTLPGYGTFFETEGGKFVLTNTAKLVGFGIGAVIAYQLLGKR